MIEQAGVRRDFQRYSRSTRRGDMMRAAEGLRQFDRPVLVVWAPEDRMMPRAHGRRFVELLPDAKLVEILDSRTLIPEDQPVALADALRAFVADSAGASSGAAN